jgi:hypothetical protein
LAGYVRDQSITSDQATVVADGYVTMIALAGMALMLAVRAALIPSTPRRTAIVTSLRDPHDRGDEHGDPRCRRRAHAALARFARVSRVTAQHVDHLGLPNNAGLWHLANY